MCTKHTCRAAGAREHFKEHTLKSAVLLVQILSSTCLPSLSSCQPLFSLQTDTWMNLRRLRRILKIGREEIYLARERRDKVSSFRAHLSFIPVNFALCFLRTVPSLLAFPLPRLQVLACGGGRERAPVSTGDESGAMERGRRGQNHPAEEKHRPNSPLRAKARTCSCHATPSSSSSSSSSHLLLDVQGEEEDSDQIYGAVYNYIQTAGA